MTSMVCALVTAPIPIRDHGWLIAEAIAAVKMLPAVIAAALLIVHAWFYVELMRPHENAAPGARLGAPTAIAGRIAFAADADDTAHLRLRGWLTVVAVAASVGAWLV